MTAIDINSFFPGLYFRIYFLILALAAVAGVLYDALGKDKIFSYNSEREWKRSFGRGAGKNVSKFSVMANVLLKNVAMSGEIASCANRHLDRVRRAAHLLLFWGFVVAVLFTLLKALFYPTLNAVPLTQPYEMGVITGFAMLLAGGLIMMSMRVNVRSEGDSLGTVIRADLFLISIITAVIVQFAMLLVDLSGSLPATQLMLIIYLVGTSLPFVTMAWSKFPHIIYKPVYAIHREMDAALGYSHLPSPSTENFIKRKEK